MCDDGYLSQTTEYFYFDVGNNNIVLKLQNM